MWSQSSILQEGLSSRWYAITSLFLSSRNSISIRIDLKARSVAIQKGHMDIAGILKANKICGMKTEWEYVEYDNSTYIRYNLEGLHEKTSRWRVCGFKDFNFSNLCMTCLPIWFLYVFKKRIRYISRFRLKHINRLSFLVLLLKWLMPCISP